MAFDTKGALAAGYSQQEINKYLASKQPKAQPKKGNWLTNLLPTAGGIAGGIAGSFVAPIAGTAVGGAAGSALGELLRQKLTGEKGVGYKKIATEAAFGGIPLGVGKGVGLAARAGAGAAKTAGKQAISSAATTGARNLVSGATKSGAKRIPVKFVDDAAMSAAKKPSTVRNVMVNPTLGDIMEHTSKRATTGRAGNFTSAVTSGKNNTIPFIETTRTKIPVSTGTKKVTSVQDIPKTVQDVFAEPVESTVEAAAKTTGKTKSAWLSPTDTGLTQKAGKNIRATSREIKPGMPKPDGGAFSTEEAARINKLDSLEITPKTTSLTKSGRYTAGEKYIDKITKEYAATPEAKAVLSQTDRDTIVSNVIREIRNNPSLNKTLSGRNQQIQENLLTDVISKAKTRGDAFKLISERINPRSSFKTMTSQGGAQEAQLYEAFRRGTKNWIDATLPAKKELNQKLSDAMTRQSVIAAQLKGGAKNEGGGIFATGKQVIKDYAEPLIGRPLEAAGRALSTPLAKLIGRETVPRAVLGGAIGGAAAADTQEPQTPQNIEDLFSQYEATNGGGTSDEQPQESQSQYPQQNFIQDVMRDMQTTGGKNVANLKMIYEMMNPETTSKASVKAQDAVASGDRAINAIESLLGSYGAGGGAQGRIAGNVAKIAGTVGLNSGAKTFEDIRTGLVPLVARSMGHTGVLTQQDVDSIKAMMPSITSTEEEANAKWANLIATIQQNQQDTMSAYSTPSSSQVDLQSIMTQ